MLVVCRDVSLGGAESSAGDTVNLTVSAGDVCTIVGSSGSGKTRLCQFLSATEPLVRGVITVDGCSVADGPRQIRQRVTNVVPEAPLWPDRSTRSNVEYVLRVCGLPKPSSESTIHALRLAEVPDRLFDAPVNELSHFHRFGVWMAIHRLRQARVLLMDDPFLRLTGWETECLARLIEEGLEGARCAVITSRSADLPAGVASRRYRITRGQLTKIETPA